MGNLQCETLGCCESAGPDGEPLRLVDDARHRIVKIRHPFPPLPSYQVALQILCFLGYSDEVTALLNLLCCNTQTYLQRHRDTLESFLVAWVPPTVASVVRFGRQTHWAESQLLFPGDKHLGRLPRYTSRPRLKAICFKQVENAGPLSAMMLIFTNGFKTPLFETLNARNMRYELKQVTLDPTRHISKISLKVNKDSPDMI